MSAIQNGFFIPFQTQITFWLLGGENILFDGGGTLDGSGQVRSYDLNTIYLLAKLSVSCGGIHCQSLSM
jgi:hypothetical protein